MDPDRIDPETLDQDRLEGGDPGQRSLDPQRFIGATRTQTDTVRQDALAALAATLEVAAPADGVVPPLWHWLLFQDWLPASALGPDGHVARGGFLPALPGLARRMWAGGRLWFPGVLRAGETATRTSTILAVTEKRGESGGLVFVTLRHAIAGPDGPAVIEEQDLVYRAAVGAAVKDAAPAPPPSEGAWRRRLDPDAVLLFRYSALTGNAHRIHYDLAYVTEVEGYPGLIVHGPLQATLLADLVHRQAPQRRLAAFAFRGRRPAFGGRPLTLEGWSDGGALQLRTLDADGAACMTAQAW